MKAVFRQPFYALIFAAYPVAYLAGWNLGIIDISEPLRPLLMALAFSGVLQLIFGLTLKDWHRAALLTTLIVALFFSFGHVANLLPNARLDVLAWIWLGIFLALAFPITRFRQARLLTTPINLLALALLAFALGSIAQGLIWQSRKGGNEPDTRALLASLRGEAQAERAAQPPNPAPDVYFIILDSYERADALQRYYNFDNSAFMQELRKRGFYVAEQSRSNYLTTTYSLSATLNMVYLNDLPHAVFAEMVSGLRTNYAMDFLHEQGYQTVYFPSGFGVTDIIEPDVWAAPGGRPVEQTTVRPAISQFELLLLQTTLGRLLFAPSSDTDLAGAGISAAFNKNFDTRRDRLEYAFTHLADYVVDGQSSFVFAHMVLPHNPYLYDADGNPLQYDGRTYLLGDKTEPERNIKYYTDQLQYTNQRVLEVIDRIQRQATTPPVIIIQGDHGHDTFFEFEAPTPEGVDLRSAILNAVYFPGGDYSALYPSITPVNTFRVVFNQFFGTDYPLLPDRSYQHPRADANAYKSKQQFTPIEVFLEKLP